MSALRWDSFDHQHLGPPEAIPSAPRARMRTPGATAITEDDAAARGVVFGVVFSLIGFWMPLTATIAWRRRHR